MSTRHVNKSVVIGTIGADAHMIGGWVLEKAFKEAGFTVAFLGAVVPQQEFINAAIEIDADAILVSSMYGMGLLDCEGLRDKCIEAGLERHHPVRGRHRGGAHRAGEELAGDRAALHGRWASTGPSPTPAPRKRRCRRSRPTSASTEGAHERPSAGRFRQHVHQGPGRRSAGRGRSWAGPSRPPPSTPTSPSGCDAALAELTDTVGLDLTRVDGKYASSSAAGGLKMAAIGLVPELTLEAARRACLGAGAKVVCSYGFEIDHEVVRGDRSGPVRHHPAVRRHRRRRQADHQPQRPRAGPVGRDLPHSGGRQPGGRRLHQGDPGEGRQEGLPGRQRAARPRPGRGGARPGAHPGHLHRPHHPRQGPGQGGGVHRPAHHPHARRRPCRRPRCWPRAPTGEPGIGSLLVVEVGGATTNIHSVADQSPVTPQTVIRGLPESRVKRTVEGDLGIRYNAPTIYDFIGRDAFTARLRDLYPPAAGDGFDPDAHIDFLSKNVGHAPSTDLGLSADIVLAESAAAIAVERHAGTARQEFSVVGEIMVQHGKNLLEVENVIGAGGHLQVRAASGDGASGRAVQPGQAVEPEAPRPARVHRPHLHALRHRAAGRGLPGPGPQDRQEAT